MSLSSGDYITIPTASTERSWLGRLLDWRWGKRPWHKHAPPRGKVVKVDGCTLTVDWIPR